MEGITHGVNSVEYLRRKEIVDLCIVVDSEGTDTVFDGSTDDTVRWLEENPSLKPRSVYIQKTADILTESQFLDLAT